MVPRKTYAISINFTGPWIEGYHSQGYFSQISFMISLYRRDYCGFVYVTFHPIGVYFPTPPSLSYVTFRTIVAYVSRSHSLSYLIFWWNYSCLLGCMILVCMRLEYKCNKSGHFLTCGQFNGELLSNRRKTRVSGNIRR